jgi:hypothetical protein
VTTEEKKAKMREYYREYRQKNAKKISEQHMASDRRHIERVRAYQREYFKTHPDFRKRRAEYLKEWRKKRKEHDLVKEFTEGEQE